MANNNDDKAPLFMLFHLDGGTLPESRVGRVAHRIMTGDFNVIVNGRPKKVASFSASFDPERGMTTVSIALDGGTITKTFAA